MADEQIYWQQLGSEKWILEGDANATFFHLVANGRRKKMILHLEEEGRHVVDQKENQETSYAFYTRLFGMQHVWNVHLEERVWLAMNRLGEGENEWLCRPFSEEIHKVIMNLKSSSAPSPDGFSYTLYKSCWETIKGDFLRMVADFYEGNLDIQRLNYGTITLIPKVKEAFNVKQFKPIHSHGINR